MPKKLDHHDIKDLLKRINKSTLEMADYLGTTEASYKLIEKGKARPSQLAQRQLHRLHRKYRGVAPH